MPSRSDLPAYQDERDDDHHLAHRLHPAVRERTELGPCREEHRRRVLDRDEGGIEHDDRREGPGEQGHCLRRTDRRVGGKERRQGE